ncbi:MAG: hypothetical protein OEN50_06665 [Deltaproteobacteria bacterium]|nr:hypothetical protein [Deltaproteobacteria bacterium]
MERRLVLEIEELEERIAPHFTPLGQGHAAVGGQVHGVGTAIPLLELPNGTELNLPVEAGHGIHTAYHGPA